MMTHDHQHFKQVHSQQLFACALSEPWLLLEWVWMQSVLAIVRFMTSENKAIKILIQTLSPIHTLVSPQLGPGSCWMRC